MYPDIRGYPDIQIITATKFSSYRGKPFFSAYEYMYCECELMDFSYPTYGRYGMVDVWMLDGADDLMRMPAVPTDTDLGMPISTGERCASCVQQLPSNF